jgi:hypothetical protein
MSRFDLPSHIYLSTKRNFGGVRRHQLKRKMVKVERYVVVEMFLEQNHHARYTWRPLSLGGNISFLPVWTISPLYWREHRGE